MYFEFYAEFKSDMELNTDELKKFVKLAQHPACTLSTNDFKSFKAHTGDGKYVTVTFDELTKYFNLGTPEHELGQTLAEFAMLFPGNLSDAIYRRLWKEYVKTDAISQFENRYDNDELSETDLNSLADFVADCYVYNGDYDCTLTYWDNIDNLIDRGYQPSADKGE